MKLTTIEELYKSNLKHLHSVEKQLVKALEKLAGAAQNEQLKQGFQAHLEQTKTQQQRIEKILEGLGEAIGRKKSKGIEAIILEGEELIATDGDAAVKDLALIDAAQRTEHHEMAMYGCTATYAQLLGREEDARLLHETLDEEKQSDARLTRMALLIARGESGAGDEGDEELVEIGELVMVGGGEDDESELGASESAGRGRRGQGSPRATRSSEDGGAASAASGRSGFYRSSERSSGMPRRDDYGYERGGGYEGRSRGGRHSAEMQERDEYGQFIGYGGGSRGSSSRGRSRYDEDEDEGYGGGGGGGYGRGGYEGRSRGGRHSAEMQERDEYGQFMGYGGGSGGSRGSSSRGRSRYDEDEDEGYGGGRGSSSRGGRSSRYDEDDDDITDSAGRHYSRESWERAQEGRSRGGQHSRGNQFTSGRGGGRYDEDDDYGNSGGGSRGRGSSSRGGRSSRYEEDEDDYITDSAGRHYSRESWERAQEGRSRGGQHSHGGGRRGGGGGRYD